MHAQYGFSYISTIESIYFLLHSLLLLECFCMADGIDYLLVQVARLSLVQTCFSYMRLMKGLRKHLCSIKV